MLALRGFAQFRGQTGRELRTWLQQILRNAIIQALRRSGAAKRSDQVTGPLGTEPGSSTPLPKAMWSQRNNNNYQQTGLLVSLAHFATNGKYFLRNFYTKSKNSILKPKVSGPAAYVFSANDPRLGGQAQLLRLMQQQGCEIHKATAPFSITIPAKKGGQAETKQFPAGEFQVPCALIIGKRKESTDLKTSLNDALRDHNVAV